MFSLLLAAPPSQPSPTGLFVQPPFFAVKLWRQFGLIDFYWYDYSRRRACQEPTEPHQRVEADSPGWFSLSSTATRWPSAHLDLP
jgi:hypothetical protein